MANDYMIVDAKAYGSKQRRKFLQSAVPIRRRFALSCNVCVCVVFEESAWPYAAGEMSEDYWAVLLDILNINNGKTLFTQY